MSGGRHQLSRRPCWSPGCRPGEIQETCDAPRRSDPEADQKRARKGGKARTASMTPQQRSALGKAAASARWKHKSKKNMRKKKTYLRGRDAKTGQFIPLSETEQRPDTTVKQRVPLPGYGVTGKGKKKKKG